MNLDSTDDESSGPHVFQPVKPGGKKIDDTIDLDSSEDEDEDEDEDEQGEDIKQEETSQLLDSTLDFQTPSVVVNRDTSTPLVQSPAQNGDLTQGIIARPPQGSNNQSSIKLIQTPSQVQQHSDPFDCLLYTSPSPRD